MVFRCVVFVALVAVASAGLIGAPIGLAQPLLRSQLIAAPQQLIAAPQQLIAAPQQIIAQQPLLARQVIAAPQQIIAQQPLLARQVIAQQPIIAQQPLLARQVIAAPQQIIAQQPLLAARQVIAAPQQIIAQQPLLARQVIAAPQVAVAAPIAKAVVAQAEEYDPNPQYSFAYDVQDALTGDSKNQQESRSGDVVQGSYSLTDPDGTRRTVEYTADPINGFNAVVHKQPLGVAVKQVVAAAPAIAHAPLAYAAAPAIAHAPLAYASPIAKVAAPLAYSSYIH